MMNKKQFQETLSRQLSEMEMFSDWNIIVSDGDANNWKLTLTAPSGLSFWTEIAFATVRPETVLETLTQLIDLHPEDPRGKQAS